MENALNGTYKLLQNGCDLLTTPNANMSLVSISSDPAKNAAIQQIMNDQFMTTEDLAEASEGEIQKLFGKYLGLLKAVRKWKRQYSVPPVFNEAASDNDGKNDDIFKTLLQLKNDVECIKISLSVLMKKSGISHTFRQQKQSEFVAAARLGQLERLKSMLNQSRSGNEYICIDGFGERNGDTALIGASQYGHFNVVKFLVEEGANLQENALAWPNRNALQSAAVEHRFDIAEYLIIQLKLRGLTEVIDEFDQNGKTAHGLAIETLESDRKKIRNNGESARQKTIDVMTKYNAAL